MDKMHIVANSGVEDKGDDKYFWEELLADDDKNWQDEYLGMVTGKTGDKKLQTFAVLDAYLAKRKLQK
jgi:hypothetical protein